MSNVANRIDYIKLPARDATKLATVKALLSSRPSRQYPCSLVGVIARNLTITLTTSYYCLLQNFIAYNRYLLLYYGYEEQKIIRQNHRRMAGGAYHRSSISYRLGCSTAKQLPQRGRLAWQASV